MSSPISTPQHTRPRGNLRALKIAVVVAFAILTVRLADMQIVNGESFAARARDNHILQEPIVGTRGLIYDRNGEPLVTNVPSFDAVIIPEFLPDSDAARTRLFFDLSRMLNVPVFDIQAAVHEQEERSPWEPAVIKDHLTHDEAMLVEESTALLPGVDLRASAGRKYIGGEAFSHILGYMGPQTPADAERLANDDYSLDEWIGQAGLETQYEAVLRGHPGTVQNEVDAFGRVVEPLSTIDPQPGNSLRLSIDADLQRYVAELLMEKKEDAPTAAAVVMNSKTGEIYALVSVPGYDNNIFAAIGEPENADQYEKLLSDDEHFPLVNHAIADENTPGSVFKLVTATGGLEEGVIDEHSGVNVPETVRIMEGENGEAVKLIDWRAHGYVDTRAAIAWSSNMFFYMTSCGFLDTNDPALGATNLKKWANIYGFGKPTGIDLPGESAGRIPSPEWKEEYTRINYGQAEPWRYGDTCQMGIGQGFVTASPLQVARMTAAVANGGTLVTPHVVKSIVAPNGTEEPLATDTRQLPVDDYTLQIIREGMLQSVTSGAAANAYRPGLAIAGKTGTAEFRKLENGEWENHAWFTSFAPYDDPEVVVTVYFELGWGGDKAAPVAGDIMKYVMENVDLE